MWAQNGVTFSNTLFFQRELGWHGLLVEANAHSFRELQRARGRRAGRNNNTLLHAAACAAGEHMHVHGRGVTSTVVDAVQGQNGRNVSRPGAAERVPCMPLGEMLHRAGLRHVDFFSLGARPLAFVGRVTRCTLCHLQTQGRPMIKPTRLSADVEGAELAVLRTMDWSIPIGVLMFEGDKHTPQQTAELRGLLGSHNFSYVRRMGSRRRNQLWVGAELRRAIPGIVAREQHFAKLCVTQPRQCDLYK